MSSVAIVRVWNRTHTHEVLHDGRVMGHLWPSLTVPGGIQFSTAGFYAYETHEVTRPMEAQTIAEAIVARGTLRADLPRHHAMAMPFM